MTINSNKSDKLIEYVKYAPVAQWIEHLASDETVGGSTPSRRTKGPVASAVELKHDWRTRLFCKAERRAATNMKFHYTYVLRSKYDNDLYIGSTGDLKQRLETHNQGGVKSTEGRRPLELIYYEACLNKKKSEHRERYFKTGFGRKFLKDRI